MNGKTSPFPLKGDFFAFSEIKVVLISLAHGVNDMYAAFLPTFVSYIKTSLKLDAGRL